jgi:hypothetical protein
MKATTPVTLLDEAGVTITSTHILTPTHKFAIRDIKRVTVSNPGVLHGLLGRTFEVCVDDFKQIITVFQTKDRALILRIRRRLAELPRRTEITSRTCGKREGQVHGHIPDLSFTTCARAAYT